jgi:hypothetical protein
VPAEEIQGWMSVAELDWLRDVASRVSSIVEVGCWKGRSTHALLESCPGPVYAVDHWMGSQDERETQHFEARYPDRVFRQFLGNVGHFKNLHVIRCNSVVASRLVPDVDMVFIDGCHLKEEVLADIRAWRPKTKVLMCGHDIGYASVANAVLEELGDFTMGAGAIWAVPFKELPGMRTKEKSDMKAKCKHCGWEQDAEALLCWNCGQDPGTQEHAQHGHAKHSVEESMQHPVHEPEEAAQSHSGEKLGWLHGKKK